MGLIADPLKELGIKHAFISGTLLGLARTGTLIDGDTDIDVAIPYEDNNRIKEILLHLKKFGFNEKSRIKREFLTENIGLGQNENSYELCFMHRNDKYAWITWYEGGNGNWINLVYPNTMWDNLDKINGFNVPSNYKEYLRMTYGNDWETPNSNYYKSKEGFYLTGKDARKYEFDPQK